jgi:4-oxalomesaconate tautomerase
VPGTAAPISINFLDTAGSVCPGLLPTGNVLDSITVTGEGFAEFTLQVTCIDNGMPLVLMRAADLGCSGYESVGDMNADEHLKRRLEALRLQIAPRMGLGDVRARNYPKMTLIAPPRDGGALSTRSFIPHVCHDAIGVLAAVTVATACVLRGTVCDGVAQLPPPVDGRNQVSAEHPTGEFSVSLASREAPEAPGGRVVTESALLRTARLIMRGEVMIPRRVWPGAGA